MKPLKWTPEWESILPFSPLCPCLLTSTCVLLPQNGGLSDRGEGFAVASVSPRNPSPAPPFYMSGSSEFSISNLAFLYPSKCIHHSPITHPTHIHSYHFKTQCLLHADHVLVRGYCDKWQLLALWGRVEKTDHRQLHTRVVSTAVEKHRECSGSRNSALLGFSVKVTLRDVTQHCTNNTERGGEEMTCVSDRIPVYQKPWGPETTDWFREVTEILVGPNYNGVCVLAGLKGLHVIKKTTAVLEGVKRWDWCNQICHPGRSLKENRGES